MQSLVKLGERLCQPCTALLEGKERENERSYLGFGEGEVITPDAGAELGISDPVEHLRSFLKVFREKLRIIEPEGSELQAGERIAFKTA